jgi:hypothetical protein
MSRAIGQLTDAEAAAGVEELKRHGIEVSHLLRLVRVGERGGDGFWRLRVRRPTVQQLKDPARPWLENLGMRFDHEEVSLAQAAAMLVDPHGGEAEMCRRDVLFAEYEARNAAENARVEQLQREAEAHRARAQQEYEAAYRNHDGRAWDHTPAWARALILVAMRRAPKDAELAADLRAVVEPYVGRETAPVVGPAFPTVRWRW